jgi:branched-chain amino acid transport system substrate-binding protein
MGRKKFLLFSTVVPSLVLVLALATACAPGAAPPPKEKVVTYLDLADYTGPIAGLNVPAGMAADDSTKEINAKGGVMGVKITYLSVDTRYDVARGVSAYKRYRNEPKLMHVVAISTALSKAITPMTEKDQVVQAVTGDGEPQARLGWVFIIGPAYQNAFGASVDFLLEDWKNKGKSGMPTIGYMNWDSAYGRELLRGGKEYAEKLGVKLLPPEFFPTGAPEHSVWLQRLASGNPDYILVAGVDPTPSNVLRDAHKLGLTKKIQFIDTSYWGPDEAVGIKLHPEAVEGCWLNCYYLRGDEAWTHPLATYMVPKYRGKSVEEFRKTTGAIYVAGLTRMPLFAKALEIALKNAGGYEKLDGKAMRAGMEATTGMDLGQGLIAPIAYSPKSRQNTEQVKFYQVKNGKEVPISGWRKVPDCVSLYDWSK